jgi:small-conductance mechanosensitive channel
VRTLEDNIESLRKTVNDAKQSLNISRMNAIKCRQSENECKERHNKLIARVNEINSYLNEKKSSINKRVETRDKLDLEIKQLMRRRVSQLTKYIFTIESSLNESNDNSLISNTETTPLLISNESNISNRVNTKYTIIEPWIPANGDYSAYLLSGK